MFTTTSARLGHSLAVLCVTVAVGCSSGPKTFEVSGKVVYKETGQPAAKLEGAYVILEPVAGSGNVAVQGLIDEEGNFRLGSLVDGKPVAGAVAGDYRVRIQSPIPRPPIALKYAKTETSGVQLSIVGNRDDVVIEVEAGRR